MPNRDDENEVYDAAFGPKRPRTRRRVAGEWDDPSWVAVEVTEWFKNLDHNGEPTNEAWLNVKEAARLLPVTEDWLRKGVRLGVLPVLTYREGGWRLWRDDVVHLGVLMRECPEYRFLSMWTTGT